MPAIQPPVALPAPQIPIHMPPERMPPASSSHVSSHQIYPSVPSQGVSTAPAGYGPHSQLPPAQGTLLPSYAIQPLPIPTP